MIQNIFSGNEHDEISGADNCVTCSFAQIVGVAPARSVAARVRKRTASNDP
jgi:hypothetical protein